MERIKVILLLFIALIVILYSFVITDFSYTRQITGRVIRIYKNEYSILYYNAFVVTEIRVDKGLRLIYLTDRPDTLRLGMYVHYYPIPNY